MKQIKYIITCFLLIMLNAAAFAQAEGLKYTMESTRIEMDGGSIPIISIITKAGNQFVWTQQNDGNESVTKYNIIDELEDWNQDNSSGFMEYTLEVNGFESTLKITGDANGVLAILSNTEPNGQIETLSFHIHTVAYN